MQTDTQKAAGNSKGNASALSKKQILADGPVEGLKYLPLTKCPQSAGRCLQGLCSCHLPLGAVDILD